MFQLAFWKAAAERAVRTVAQTMLSLWIVGNGLFDAFHVDWGQAAGIGAGAAILSLLTSLVATAAGPATGPSFGTETPTGA